MIAVAGTDPADAVVASQRDRLLDGAGYDEAAEPVIAIDDSGRPRLPDDRDLGPRVEPARLDAADQFGGDEAPLLRFDEDEMAAVVEQIPRIGRLEAAR